MIKTAIACMSGSLKCVFVHGVLHALENHKFKADAYAACSSSTLMGAFAASGKISELSLDIWLGNIDYLKQPGIGMSEVVKGTINKFSDSIRKNLFNGSSSRFIVPCSFVRNDEAALLTQGERASMLGRKLLLLAARKDNQWAKENLDRHIFDTEAGNKEFLLSTGNYEEVFYATSRMLHAWRIPAVINGKPYVDGSYTCMCPVEPLIDLGYKNIIVIATEPGEIYTDLFSSKIITYDMKGSKIDIIQPDTDLKNLGVEFTRATREGLQSAFEHGIVKGSKFINKV